MTAPRSSEELHLDLTGRIGVDIYPLQDGVGLQGVTTFGNSLACNATNGVLGAAAGPLERTRGDLIQVPLLPVTASNGLSAGDGFSGALVHGLLEGWLLRRTLQLADAVDAIVASRRDYSTAIPTQQEVDQRLAEVPA